MFTSVQVVCIDEGTANLDSESERNIQLVLREAFKESTVLLIAHRATSLQNTDRVVIMQDGRVVEDGATKDLFTDSESVCYALMNQQQETSMQRNEALGTINTSAEETDDADETH